MTGPEPRQDRRSRLYDVYVSTHGMGDDAGKATAALARQVTPLLPVDRGARILEIGCGTGELVKGLRELGYSRVEGVDVSPEQVALAADRGIEGVRETDLFDALAAEPASLDAVVALDVLEHFEPDMVLTVLDAVAAALRPGGVFVARTPNATSPFAGRYRYGDLTHGLSFTPRSVRQATRAAGFASLVVRPVNPVPHGIASTIRLLVWLAIAATMKAILVAETGQVRGHVVTQNMMVVARRPGY